MARLTWLFAAIAAPWCACGDGETSPGPDGNGGDPVTFSVAMVGRGHATAVDVGGWQVTLTTAALWIGDVTTIVRPPATGLASLSYDNAVDLLGPEVPVGMAMGSAGPYDSLSVEIGRVTADTLWLAGRAEKNGVTKTFGTTLDRAPEVVVGIPIAGDASPSLLVEVHLDRWLGGIDFEDLPAQPSALDFENFPQAHNALVDGAYDAAAFTGAWRTL